MSESGDGEGNPRRVISRFDRGARFSKVVVYNGTAFFSGLTSDDRSGDICAQTHEVLVKADELLGKIGSTRSDIISAMVWLRDIDDYGGMNEIWETWIDKDQPPARATVEAKLASADIKIEIQFIVAVG